MAKLVYKGKINGNDVVYKEGCLHFLDRLEGGNRQNIMDVVTETGKEFRFRTYHDPYFILDYLEENRDYIHEDTIDDVIIKEKEKKIKEEVEDAFDTDTKTYGLCLYRDDTKKFIKFFSKIDKGRKKGLLNEIFSCGYENKEVIEWLNKNETDLLREVGFDG